jgi:hypothetical protein
MLPKRRSKKIRPQTNLQNNSSQDMYWGKEIEDMMKLGYSYKLAYALVSKEKIQELFDKDVRITGGR